jgi:hypothetical protein
LPGKIPCYTGFKEPVKTYGNVDSYSSLIKSGDLLIDLTLEPSDFLGRKKKLIKFIKKFMVKLFEAVTKKRKTEFF